jgi:succinoglycan biosynthesis protein ExoV
MFLYHWQGHARNFGDELNTLLWPSLLPGYFDDDASEIFLGIGSVLDSRHPAGARKTVAGAGYGGYRTLPSIDESWTIHWVRGPRTAGLLGLPAALGIGDPASLIDDDRMAAMLGAGWRQAAAGCHDVGFMPHFETACRGAWQRAAAEAGLAFIDPRDDPRAVLAAVARCRLLLSEAMHGVIVADALRVPWVPIAPFAPIHAAKWDDWAAAMSTSITFEALPPSSFGEHLRLSGFAGCRVARSLLDHGERRLRTVAAAHFAERAASALRRAADASPCLTEDRALDRSRDRMWAALDRLHGAHALRSPAASRSLMAPPAATAARSGAPAHRAAARWIS